MHRIVRWSGALLAVAAGAAALTVFTAGPSPAEIHNGGVDCTNWNGLYQLASASGKDPALLPAAGDTIVVRQQNCAGVDMDVTLAGKPYTLMARTTSKLNRHRQVINGRPTRVYASWIDGYGKNWLVQLTPDPLRPHVPYSVREYQITSFHTITVQATVHNPRNQVPLATFPERGQRVRGSKVRDIVDARAVYLMPVSPTQAPSASQLRGTDRRKAGSRR